MIYAGGAGNQPGDIFAGQHDRQVLGARGTGSVNFAGLMLQDVAIEKQQGVECLVLSAGRDVPLLGQIGQISPDGAFGNIHAMVFVFPDYVVGYPALIGALGIF